MTLVDVIGGLDRQAHGPLYQRLHRALRDAIADKRLRIDEALPAERDIAHDLGISRITVRKAIDALVEEGLVTRRQGAGTFVAARIEKSFSKLSSFSEDMVSRGRVPRSVWLGRAPGTVTRPRNEQPQWLSRGTPMVCATRWYFTAGFSTMPSSN